MKLFIERFPTVAAGLDVEPQHVALALHRLAVAGQQDVVSPHLGRAAGRRLLLRHPLGQQVPGDGGLRDRHLAVKLSTSIREVGAFSVILKLRNLREPSFEAVTQAHQQHYQTFLIQHPYYLREDFRMSTNI